MRSAIPAILKDRGPISSLSVSSKTTSERSIGGAICTIESIIYLVGCFLFNSILRLFGWPKL